LRKGFIKNKNGPSHSGMSEENQRKLITDDLEIIDIFRLFYKSKENLWLWQQTPDEQGERPVHFCQVRKLDVLKKLIELTPLSDDGFTFSSKEKELFLYSRKKNIAVKFKPRELESHYIMLSLPQKMNSLSPELAKKISLVEAEDESSNAHKRTQPRKSAGEKQTIKAYKESDVHKVKLYNLYDISAGGLALKAPDPGVFKKGDHIFITSINTKDLDNPVKGKVVSIRHMEEDDLFKVGVQFV